MKLQRILIVDSSPIMRKMITAIISRHSNFEVIGIARTIIDAQQKIQLLQPTCIIVNREFGKDKTLQEAFKYNEISIVIVDLYENIVGLKSTGWIKNYISKEEIIQCYHNPVIKESFLKSLIKEDVETLLNEEMKVDHYINNDIKKTAVHQLIVIGSSTGGPKALQKVLEKFDSNFSIPILVVQHMPTGFTKSLAERFNKYCALCVKEAEHGEPLQGGTIYIAPAGIHSVVKRDKEHYKICLEQISEIASLYKPSIDTTLKSVAEQFHENLLVTILTGMGDDGLLGCKEVKLNGGLIITEAEETCVVYGMPKVVYEAGLSNIHVPIDEIYEEIMLKI